MPPFSPPTRQRVGSILWLTTPSSCRLVLPCSPAAALIAATCAGKGQQVGEGSGSLSAQAAATRTTWSVLAASTPYSFYRRALSGCPAAVATCASAPRSGRLGCARTDRAPASRCSNKREDFSVKYLKIAQFSGHPQQGQSSHRQAILPPATLMI